MIDETGLSKSRLEALTDGIFAVVMTLLILDISIPQISSYYAASDPALGTDLLKRLFDLWPEVFIFGISFIILATYWMAHNRQFQYIMHVDRTLIWINIIFLMATCFLPFSTSLLGAYREQQISVFVYGGNSIIIGSLLYIQWWYVTSHRSRLMHANLEPIVKTALHRNLLFGIIVYLVVIAISFVHIHLSVFLFLLILIPTFLPNKMIHGFTSGGSHKKR